MSDRMFGVIAGRWNTGDVSSVAVDSKGHAHGGWLSSSESWARLDLPRSLPDDVELVWVTLDDPRLPKPCEGCDECEGDATK